MVIIATVEDPWAVLIAAAMNKGSQMPRCPPARASPSVFPMPESSSTLPKAPPAAVMNVIVAALNIASPTQPDVDIMSLSALTAANFGATAEIARLLGEEEFTLLFHKGKSENVYFSAVGENTIMVALFDDKTSLGVIRLKMNQIVEELGSIVSCIFEKGKKS